MAAFDAAAPATWTVDNLKAQTNDALAALLGQHNLTVDKDDDRRDDRKGDARLVKADYVRTCIDYKISLGSGSGSVDFGSRL